ncbi:MAG: GTP pyrophosphokinase family protein [Ruminococcaceae bacterium]|jgi:ppGpp synthetase/RelA/SpoT-type nucleotidyltranferase|nr:GTP pyrophosphokinase family protein [Oscillospiraceae bacterium]
MDSIYGEHAAQLEATLEKLLAEIDAIRADMSAATGMDPVEHTLGRIKTEESMREKCRRQGLPETEASALETIHDAIGVRVVCAFLDDVYEIRDRLAALPFLEVVEEKNYIRHAKPNGYRSLHLIVRVDGRYFAEIQLRTISMDTWAALEHHLKYKKDVRGNLNLITGELKRCADELASTDASMQTIRDMIRTM